MKQFAWRIVAVVLMVALAGCSGSPEPTVTPLPGDKASATAAPAAAVTKAVATQPVEEKAAATDPLPTEAVDTPPVATEATAAPPADPFELVSVDSLFAFLEDLTAIQAYSGWRNSASSGEAEALDYVTQKLEGFAFLQGLGLELERQSFHVFLGTELRETGLLLTVGGRQVEVPADGLRGPRDDAEQALRFDSDGVFNDSTPDPVVAEGPVALARSMPELEALGRGDVEGNVVFLDYALVDRSIMSTQQAVIAASALLAEGPAGLVLVTSFSNEQNRSHGAFVGDGSALTWVEVEPVVPVLYARLEDLTAAGIEGWDGLEAIEAARLTWDADVFAPGTSGNLVARIPGADPSQAVILGAHIDSPNAPGAMDDGSGSAILLEVARVLDAAQAQPATDLYLVWFGSEELGLYGASHFVATHQELLDRTLAMLQIDCLTRPLDGLAAEMRLVTWPYGRFGDGRLVWPDYLSRVAAQRGVGTVTQDVYAVYSDNSTFGGFDVPHADLIYEPLVGPNVSVHYSGHLHDPYDEVELAWEMAGELEQMAHVALTAALETASEDGSLRVTPPPDRRALFVGSHTEALHMTPISFTELGMALAMEGFDVDLIPYGQPVTAADLQDADLVVALPVVDYPSPAGDPGVYDEAWTPEEIAALEAYAAGGGLLVLANSAYRLKYGNQGLDPNEDWEDANALASQFGVTYRQGALPGTAQTEGEHPLIAGLGHLEMGDGNGLPFDLAQEAGVQVLAVANGQTAMALLDYGDAGGQVLVLADVGMLTTGWGEPQNLDLWRNLARYAR